MDNVLVSGSFDNIRSREVRFLEEAARFGPVHVCLWSDQVVKRLTGADPRFPHQERKYFLEAVRFVQKVWTVDELSDMDALPQIPGLTPGLWIVPENDDSPARRRFCVSYDLQYLTLSASTLQGFPNPDFDDRSTSSNKKVLVTGCYDWFHSGHVRFFEETSTLGELYVVVGHDENVRLLKGKGHPLISQDERRYMVGAIRFVKAALISTGSGWMDAEPEIEAIRPDLYVVNEDGDKPQKREFCEKHGLEYVVLKRVPAAGLPRRESTRLRGF